MRKDDSVTNRARKACEKWRDYFKQNIDQYYSVLDFTLNRQWEQSEEDTFKTYKKAPLQFNKLATLVNSLLGEQQQNTPQIEVQPLSGCSEETAKIRQVITKDIMLSTDAKTVYQNAAFQAFTGGFGAFMLDTEYTNESSFDVDIVYRAFKDPTRCYWDVSAEHPNKIDGMYCGYVERMSRDKFSQLYGKGVEQDISPDTPIAASKEEVAAATEVSNSTSDDGFNWADTDGITINHYLEKEYYTETFYALSDGTTATQEEMDELIADSKRFLEMQGVFIEEPEDENAPQVMTLYRNEMPISILKSKERKRAKINHYKIAGEYILEETEFPAELCPVIFMDQESFYGKDGKQVCRPFIVDAIDAQRYINYLGTHSAYLLKISRYDQFIASINNVKSPRNQEIWKNPANVQGALTYDESPSGAKPEQLRPPELPVSLVNQYQRAIEDLYTSTGLYPTRLGQQGNEISGDAIDARTRQGSYSTFVAFNSVNKAITAGGKVLNQMIPRVYDTQRVMNITSPDKGREIITVNEEDEFGNIRHSLKEGNFEVKLVAGPSYEGQKQEALSSINLIVQSRPELFDMFADLYAENLPLANTTEIRNRLKTIVPPDVVEAGKTGRMPEKQQQPNPQAQAIMAEIQINQEKLEIQKQELQIQLQEQQLKVEQAQAELETKRLELAANLEQQKLRYMAETQRTQSDNAISHANNLTKILLHKDKTKERA